MSVGISEVRFLPNVALLSQVTGMKSCSVSVGRAEGVHARWDGAQEKWGKVTWLMVWLDGPVTSGNLQALP